MSRWQSATLADNEAISSAASAVGTAGDAVQGALNAFKAAIAVAKAFVALLPSAPDMSEAVQQLVNTVFDVFSSGVYYYMDGGSLVSGFEPDGINGFVDRWAKSFDDLGDESRPQFSDDAEISASLILVGANDLPSLAPLIASFIEFFDFSKLKAVEGKDLELNWYDQVESEMSTPPDWKSLALKDVLPIYSELEEGMKEAAGLFKTATGMSAQVDALASAIEKKADKISEILERIVKIADQLQALEDSGFFILDLNSQTGIDGLVNAAQNADTSEIELDADALVFGVCLLAGGPDKDQFITAKEKLWSIA